MTETNLTDLLGEAANRVPVAAAPFDAIVIAARRTRRVRTAAGAVGTGLVVAAAIVGTVLVTGTHDSTPSPSPAPVAPTGMRLVGVGHAAIAVPGSWATNALGCGTPTADTVIVDAASTELCLIQRPRGVESVEITQGKPRFDFSADESITIDGERAERQRTTCSSAAETERARGVRLCTGTVRLTDSEINFRAESSTGPEEVDEILSRIQIVPDLVAVPGVRTYALRDQEKSAAAYTAALERAGLTVQLDTVKRPGLPPGYVLGASPDSGTMLAPGSVVKVTAVARPTTPADEVQVGMNSSTPQGKYHGLEDGQVRAGATIRLAVGDTIWAYASAAPQHGQDLAETLAGTLGGTSLQQIGEPGDTNYPTLWKAVRPGTTTVELTVSSDGKPDTIGIVTVVVAP